MKKQKLETNGALPSEITKRFKSIRRKLLIWGPANFRDYPWRRPETGYHSLIAEILLQRTRADQVAPVYLEFIQEFPDIERLTRARRRQIEKYLKRLGLIWRTDRILEMAKFVKKNYSGKIPEKKDDILNVPGAGEYVASAVLCFYYREREYILDSNIARLYVRLFGIKTKSEARRDKIVKKIASAILPRKNYKKYNFALLDFTALICKPVNPLCYECILNKLCDYGRDKFEKDS